MLVFQTSPLGVELFLMWMLSFVSIYLHRCWPSDWKLSLELLYWCDKISFWTTPPTEICCLHSQIIFRHSKKSFVLLKLWLAAQSSLILCNSWTPRSSIKDTDFSWFCRFLGHLATYKARSARFTAFLLWNSCQRSIVASRSLTFVRLLASKIQKDINQKWCNLNAMKNRKC